MLTLIAIGLLGGLITGISPCILPVLPVIFFSSSTPTSQGRTDSSAASGTATATLQPQSATARPYLVIAGLVLSFSAVTLTGSTILALLHLPGDTLRWVALAALVAVGLGLIFPGVEMLLEKPFSRLPQKQFNAGGGGFVLGLALGVLYVPCAGPVLAAIVLAGATGAIGLSTIALTVSFAVGAALPLLCFALAGQRVSHRVNAFRRHQRGIRVTAGVMTILVAVALVCDVPAVLQRAIPDYTHTLQQHLGDDDHVRQKLNLGGIVTDENAQLSQCTDGADALQNCGAAPGFRGITGWLNTPGNSPIDLKSLRGRVVLIDFWAYSCINCQRAIPHVVAWSNAYRDHGLVVIGVHTPEYAFERDARNVADGAANLGINYPIALDNAYSTWTTYRNRYWPAEYLIDADGTVRHIKFGEGDYSTTETLIRQLLSKKDPAAALPPPTDTPDTTPTSPQTPETYFGVGKVVNYGGAGPYDQGDAAFAFPPQLADNRFALRGNWTLDYQGATARSDDNAIALNYHARNVYLVVGGTGTVTVTRNGQRTTTAVSGPPNMHQVVTDDAAGAGHLDLSLSRGLQVFSFTYG